MIENHEEILYSIIDWQSWGKIRASRPHGDKIIQLAETASIHQFMLKWGQREGKSSLGGLYLMKSAPRLRESG